MDDEKRRVAWVENSMHYVFNAIALLSEDLLECGTVLLKFKKPRIGRWQQKSHSNLLLPDFLKG